MPIEVEVPNVGIIEFPDDYDEDEIERILREQYPSRQVPLSDPASPFQITATDPLDVPRSGMERSGLDFYSLPEIPSDLSRMTRGEEAAYELQQMRQFPEVFPAVEGGLGTQVGLGLQRILPSLGEQAWGALAGLNRLPTVERFTGAGPNPAIQQFLESQAAAKGEAVEALGQVAEMTGGPKMVGDIVAGAGSVAPSLAGSGLGFRAMVAIAGLQSYGSGYSEAKRQGLSEPEAQQDALIKGVVTALVTGGFGRTGVESLAVPATRVPMREAVGQVLRNAGLEATEESTDESLQTVYDALVRNPDMTLADAAYRVFVAGAAGGLFGGGTSAMNIASGTLRERQLKKSAEEAQKRAEIDFAAIEALRLRDQPVQSIQFLPEGQSALQGAPLFQTPAESVQIGQPPRQGRPPREQPVVPETPAEQRLSITEEIRQSGARTIADIQNLFRERFPQSPVPNREQARRLRNLAFEGPPPSGQRTQPVESGLGLAPPSMFTTQEERRPDARQVREAAPVYEPLPAQPVEGEGQVPAEVSRERVQPQAEEVPEVEQEGVLLTAEQMAALPTGEALDYFNRKYESGERLKPHREGIRAGLKLGPENVPALRAMAESVLQDSLSRFQAGDEDAFTAGQGKVTWINGAIEGALREGPNYDLFVEREGEPASREQQPEGPAVTQASEPSATREEATAAMAAEGIEPGSPTETVASQAPITPERISVESGTKQPAFRVITEDEASSPQTLGDILTQDARRGLGPKSKVSLTRRVTAIQNKQTGEVHLVSTYPHGRTGIMMVDPEKAASARPNRQLGEVMDRFTPIRSVLLDEPVQNFHQKFDSVEDFQSRFGEQAEVKELVIKPNEAEAFYDLFEGKPPATREDMNDVLNQAGIENNEGVVSAVRKSVQLRKRSNPELSSLEALEAALENFYETITRNPQREQFIQATVAPAGQTSDEGARPGQRQAAPLEAPSSQALGFAPPGSAEIQDAIEAAIKYFKPATPNGTPQIRIQRGKKVIRLQTLPTEKLLATTPQGMANVPGLGALVDPRATAKTGEDVALITRASSVEKGKTLAAFWAQSQHRFRNLFKADEETGQMPLADGTTGFMSDVIEAEIRKPGSQPLSELQRAWINKEWLPVKREVDEMLRDEGVNEVADEDFTYKTGEAYFPRPAIGKRNLSLARAITGGRPGVRQFFQKGRVYKTEAEGVASKDSIIYDPNAISRVGKWLAGAHRAVADHRLATDPDLQGQTTKERYDRMVREATGLQLLTAKDREEALAQLRDRAARPIWGRIESVQIAPAFYGKWYPAEVAAKLRKAYAAETGHVIRAAQNVTAASKALTAVGDLSQFMIQGAGMMGRHPVRWARAVGHTLESLADPNVVAKLMENPELRSAGEEFVQSGGSLFRLQDFLEGAQAGRFVTRLGIPGKIIERLGNAYGAFIDLGKLYMWQARSQAVPRSDWGNLAETVENSMFMGRMEQIGLNPHRTIAERLLLFAPAYYRGAGGLITTALQRGATGKVAREMLAGYGTAGLLFFGGMGALMTALGVTDWDDIKKRLNPAKGNFMTLPVEVGDGHRVNLGIGNVLTQLFRLVFQAYGFHTENQPIDTGAEGNPYVRFLRGRAAFLPGVATDIVTGKDYMGNRIPITESLVRRFIPFSWQAMFPREEQAWTQRGADASFTFFGMRSFPESEFQEERRKIDELSQSSRGKPFRDLTLSQRATVIAQYKRQPEWQRRETDVRDMERFIRLAEKRRLDLEGSISEKAKDRLDEMGLRVGAYTSTFSIDGVDVPLTDDEMEIYERNLASEYDRMVAKMPKSWEGKRASLVDELWQDYQSDIRDLARAKTLREIRK